MAEKISLTILTPSGEVFERDGIDVIVFRRQEKQEPGSEVAVFQYHGKALIRASAKPFRYHTGGDLYYVANSGGFVRINNNIVQFLTSKFQIFGKADKNPYNKALAKTLAWSKEQDFTKSMIGYL